MTIKKQASRSTFTATLSPAGLDKEKKTLPSVHLSSAEMSVHWKSLLATPSLNAGTVSTNILYLTQRKRLLVAQLAAATYTSISPATAYSILSVRSPLSAALVAALSCVLVMSVINSGDWLFSVSGVKSF